MNPTYVESSTPSPAKLLKTIDETNPLSNLDFLKQTSHNSSLNRNNLSSSEQQNPSSATTYNRFGFRKTENRQWSSNKNTIKACDLTPYLNNINHS